MTAHALTRFTTTPPRGRRASWWMAFAFALLLGACEPATAATCSYDASTKTVTQTINYGDMSSILEVRVLGDGPNGAIAFGPTPANSQCGAATVSNTDLIELVPTNNGFTQRISKLIIDTSRPIAPGATNEGDGSSEIEISMQADADILLRGGNGSEHFTEGGLGINLNAGEATDDVDLTPNAFWDPVEMDGRGGNDTLSNKGGDGTGFPPFPESDSDMRGGPGDDHLISTDSPNQTIALFDDATSGARVDFGNTGSQNIGGGLGHDTLSGIHVGMGSPYDDVFYASDTTPSDLDGGKGNDELHGGAMFDQLQGSDGNDTIYGAGSSDSLSGEGGDDEIHGGEGSDMLLGDAYPDGMGDDLLVGGSGADLLVGRGGADTLEGEAGDDTMDPGGSEADSVDGGGDEDLLSYSPASESGPTGGVKVDLALDGIQNTLGGGLDTIVGTEDVAATEFDDELLGDAGPNRLFAGIYHSSGEDEIAGRGGNDELSGGLESWQSVTLRGGAGDDTLSTGQVGDFLYGGSGDDVLDSGCGDDYLDGESGEDDLDAGCQNDLIVADDGEPDHLDCGWNSGDDIDTLLFDSGLDTLGSDCELDEEEPIVPGTPVPTVPGPSKSSASVPPPGATPASPDKRSPAVRMFGGSAIAVGAIHGTVPVAFKSDEPGVASATATTSLPGISKQLKLRSKSIAFSGTGRTSLGLRVSARARAQIDRAVKRSGRLRLRVRLQVKDLAGNVSTTKRTVSIVP